MLKNGLKFFLLFLLVFSFLGISNQVKAEEPTEVWFFHSNGCAHCAHAAPVLEQMAEDNDLNIVDLELSTSLENQEKFLIMSEVYQHEPGGVPTVLINDQWIEGFDALAYRTALEDCLESDSCSQPSDLYKAWFENPDNEEKIASLKHAVPPAEQESQLWYSIGFIVVVVMIIGIIWLNVKK